MNVCQVIFSTNRPEYLARTLASQANLMWPLGCNVHKLLIDDFPHGRDDDEICRLAHAHGYDEIHLHERNESLGATWRHCWDLLKERNLGWIWQQEDDVEILHPVKLATLMLYMGRVPRISQLRLARQGWYPGENPTQPLPSDDIIGPFRIDTKRSAIFSPMASLFGAWVSKIDFSEWYWAHYPDEPILAQTNPNEGLVGKMLLEGFGATSQTVKSAEGLPLVSHIGDYSQGRILLPHEPTAGRWLYKDPERRYCSKTGKPYA